MPTPTWSPGTLYPPGSLVQPLSAPTPQAIPPDNPSFELGDVDWDKGTSVSIVNGVGFNGTWSARLDAGFTGQSTIVNDLAATVIPGQSITASCMVQQGASSAGNAGGWVTLFWFDGSDSLISTSNGNNVNSASGGAWRQSTVTAVAPANAATVRIGGTFFRNSQNHPVWMDLFQWNYVLQAPAGLIYKAVQPAAGLSASTEPTWPLVNGQTVIDNEVIWEAVLLTRIVWEAQPILISGATEPTWPTSDGDFVADGSIKWEAVSRRVEDPKCPNSRIVLIAASKIFAADNDIGPYSATVNPLDWSSSDDAGYLPTNLQQYGANPIAGMGLYRGNLVVMNSQGSQVWQVDEDPAQMALLDAFPVGTSWHDAISPAFNDLFFLTSLGVRTLGIAGGSTNLQAGDAGMPIDPLVQAKLAIGDPSMSLYYPALGQYWLFFGNEAFVYTMNQLGKVGAWTRYVFPFTPTDYTIKGEDLYLRAGDIVHRVNPDLESDEQIDDLGYTEAVPFDWSVQWPWLDMGQMTVTKMMIGFDIIGYGNARIQFGYDQSNGGLFTPEWEIPADSVPGMLLPMPLAAPSIAVRVTYTGNDVTRTGLDALNLWLQDQRATA